jgi:hypothetical protein
MRRAVPAWQPATGDPSQLAAPVAVRSLAMSGQFLSARRAPRLSMELLEAREVPATFAVNIHDDPFFFDTNLTSLRRAIDLANANPGPDTNAAGDFDVIGDGGTK